MDVEILADMLDMEFNSLSEKQVKLLDTYIDAGIEYINNYFKKKGCNIVISKDDVSPSFKIAIKQYVEVTDKISKGLSSVSIGDLSMNYETNNDKDNPYVRLDSYLATFIDKSIKFIPIRR